ncbi:MAG: sulfatase [Haloarculaceae archaeon]
MSDRPNVVLVTVDSLRADHCGFAGYGRDTTPTLDRMADSGLNFETAVAPGPATPESMPAIFTGQFPAERKGTEGSDLAARRERIRRHMEARDSLPEMLSRRGYRTAAFTPNPFTSRHFSFDRGFDRFQDFMDESNRSGLYQRVFQGFLEESPVSSMARILLNLWQREEVFKPWESYYEEAIEWVRSGDEPYFLWVFLMDAHNPYMSGAEYRTQPWWKEFHANFEFWRQSHETPFSPTIHDRLVTAYDDSVRYSDAFLERLLADLGGDDPVVAVHGDHGEAFGERGTYGHEPYLYDENVHVPLVLSGLEDRDVPGPVSLRSLPGMLCRVAEDRDPVEEERPYVVSKTRQGGRTALYGREWRYVTDGTGEELYRAQDGDPERIDDGQLRDLCGRLVAHQRASEAEGNDVAAVAGLVAEDA